MAKTPKVAKKSGSGDRLPSNLAWRRSINISEGEMFAIIPANGDTAESRIPVEVMETTVRGAMASYAAGYDKAGQPLTADALEKAQNPTKPNIQTIQLASLPSQSDTLEISFAMSFSNDSARPETCNSGDFRELLQAFQDAARNAGLHADLAARYVWNLANGRMLWRNGYGADRRVTIETTGGMDPLKVVFECDLLSTERFPSIETVADASNSRGNAVELVNRVAAALAVGNMLALRVSVRVRLYPGAEVWPSQEFATKEAKKRDGGGEISRILSSKPSRFLGRDIMHATMHSQKIGNAIRTIDEWHGERGYHAIPVEAFGWVQRDQAAIRRPGVNDAYTALRNIAELTDAMTSRDLSSRDTALFVLAIMLRGGVYPMSGAAAETGEGA